MPCFLVRTNCELSITVEAGTADEAMDRADKIPYDEWDKDWSPFEAEEIDGESVDVRD